MFKQFLSNCRVVTKSYKLPEFKYSGENVVALFSNAEISLKPAVHRPYHGNFNEPIQDGQADDLLEFGQKPYKAGSAPVFLCLSHEKTACQCILLVIQNHCPTAF